MSIKSFISKRMPDKVYLTYKYYQKFHKLINWKHPKTFNEKIQWLKVYDRRNIYTTMVDKYAVKEYVANIIGSQYIIPTIGVWNNFDEIDFSKLPDQFVLKCTHDSGGLVICKDKLHLDLEVTRRKIEDSLKTDYYKLGREWPYKNVPRRIIAEKFMSDSNSEDIMDYKIFTFNGIPRIIQVDYNRFTDHKRNIYTSNWKFINVQIEYPNDANHTIPKPARLKEMLEIAEKLSKGYPHIRVDLYYINEKIYFGELTLYHGSGQETFIPETFGLKLGNYIDIPKKSCRG